MRYPKQPMTAAQFRRGLKVLDLPFDQEADKFDVHPRTIRRWRNGERKIPGPAAQLLRRLVEEKENG